ncbi:MAG: hypothetical protein JXC85_03295 [Candidatus Aenigmarchaeota archaeon]|nr:hypothetical protein [Candidatus Aenigmarchaeota archaeon]
MKELIEYRSKIQERERQAAQDKALSYPMNEPLDITNPRRREVHLEQDFGSGSFLYSGEAIKFEAMAEDGNAYPVVLINRDKTRQDEFIRLWREVSNGGYKFILKSGAKFNPRSWKEIGQGKLPLPVTAFYDKEPGTNIEKQLLFVACDDPNFVQIVPEIPGGIHYQASGFDCGLELIRRMEIDGMSPENVSFARFFIDRYWESLSAVEKKYINEFAECSQKIRQQRYNEVLDLFEKRIEDQSEAFGIPCD